MRAGEKRRGRMGAGRGKKRRKSGKGRERGEIERELTKERNSSTVNNRTRREHVRDRILLSIAEKTRGNLLEGSMRHMA